MNPSACGTTAVTFNTTVVAPAGTTTADEPFGRAIEPVTCNTLGVGDTNGPTNPNPERVSNTRAGVTDTTNPPRCSTAIPELQRSRLSGQHDGRHGMVP